MRDLEAFKARVRERRITRWVTPLVAEPSYGLLARLTVRMGWTSFRIFADDLLIDGGHAVISGCLEALRASGMGTQQDHAAIARWTPTFDGPFVTIAGERLPQRTFTLATRRFCPACLHEHPHHRVWFDLRFFHRCPHHGLALTDRAPDGATVRWRRADLAMAGDGSRLSRHSPTIEPYDDLETFVLRRFGTMPPLASPLDGVPLLEVVRSVGQIGRLVLDGHRSDRPVRGSPGFEPERVQEIGWRYVSRGREGMLEALKGVAGESRREAFGKKHLYGWLTQMLIENRSDYPLIADAMDQLTVDMGLDRRGTIDKVPTAPVPFLTPFEIATELGLAVDTVYVILARVGVALPRLKEVSGLQILVARADFEKVAAYAHGGRIRTSEEVRNTITRPQVAAYLGIPESLVFQLVKGGYLRKYVYSFSNNEEDRFSYPFIEEFLDSVTVTHPRPVRGTRQVSAEVPDVADLLSDTLFDAADFFAAVAAGELRIDWRVGTGRGLRDFRMTLGRQPPGHPFTIRAMSLRYTRVIPYPAGTISQKEAAAILEVKPHTVQALCVLGKLKLVEKEGFRDRIQERSVLSFAQRYAAGKLYNHIIGSSPHLLPRRLAEIGVKPLDRKMSMAKWTGNSINILVDRRDMREALSLRGDPDETDARRAAWKRFARHLGSVKSPFYCARIRDDGSAAFVSQWEYIPVDVRYVVDDETAFDWAPGRQVYRIEARFELDGAEGRKRVEADGAVLSKRDCRRMGVDLAVDLVAKSCSASITATVVCLCARVDDVAELMERYLEEDAGLIHRMLLLIRLSLEVGRGFRPELYGRWPVAFFREAA